jgi:hypothetical protein
MNIESHTMTERRLVNRSRISIVFSNPGSHQGFATLSYGTVNQLLNQSDEPIHNYPISVHKATVRDEEHMKPYGLTLLDLDFLPCLYLTQNLTDTNY